MLTRAVAARVKSDGVSLIRATSSSFRTVHVTSSAYPMHRSAAPEARPSAVWWLLLATSSASRTLAPSIRLSAIPAASLTFQNPVFAYKCLSPARASVQCSPSSCAGWLTIDHLCGSKIRCGEGSVRRNEKQTALLLDLCTHASFPSVRALNHWLPECSKECAATRRCYQVTPGLLMWESCRRMHLVVELPQGFPVSPALEFRCCSIATSLRAAEISPLCPCFPSFSILLQRLACPPPTKAIRIQSRPGHRISACGNRAGRCRWSAGFLGDIPFPLPLHSGAAPYSPQAPSSALKTTLLRAAQITSFIHSFIRLGWLLRRSQSVLYLAAPLFTCDISTCSRLGVSDVWSSAETQGLARKWEIPEKTFQPATSSAHDYNVWKIRKQSRRESNLVRLAER
ncbi:hypothetical protein PR048_019456 [Dryococelus australis]|uniref:Uncharacterized protein n=1 Tax=Dryococelus australis TaxID=614101 RepID=A0ABQ9H3J8_9NEOP|nr:hypothetical protein PR048_019456 [Dryococelus australis]